MKILIDADACPKQALDICFSLGKKFGLEVWTIANFNHNIQSQHHIIVGNACQEADIKIANLTQKADVVVTQDWGLAALILGKQAECISPAGMTFRRETISALLEERELKAKFRRAGGRTKGPQKRTDDDNICFESALGNAVFRSFLIHILSDIPLYGKAKEEIQNRPYLVSVISDTLSELRKRFHDNLLITTINDPEGVPSVVINIVTNSSITKETVQENLDRLNHFDQEWWHDNASDNPNFNGLIVKFAIVENQTEQVPK